MATNIVSLTVRVNGEIKQYNGRLAWALSGLISAGPNGCTPISHPGPRWSGYVFKLRRDGLNIETIHELHGGAYIRHHARYVLRTPVVVIELREAA